MRFFLLALMFASGTIAFAQTRPTDSDKKISDAINISRTVDDTVAYLKELSLDTTSRPDTVTLRYVKEQTYKTLALLEQAKVNSSNENKKAISYFTVLTFYNLGSAYQACGMKREAITEFEKTIKGFDSFQDRTFPVTYWLDNSGFQIGSSYFYEAKQNVHYYLMVDYSDMNNYPKFLEWANYIYNDPASSMIDKFDAEIEIIEMKSDTKVYDQEGLTAVENALNLYSQLSDEDKTFVEGSGWDVKNYMAVFINELMTGNPGLFEDGTVYAAIGRLFEKTNQLDRAKDFYDLAMSSGYTDTEFLFDVAFFGQLNNKTALESKACNKLYNKLINSTDCDAMSRLANYYSSLGNSDRATELQKKSQACVKQAAKTARQDLRKARGQVFYLGTYPLALATRFNDYRDYGVVGGVMFGKIGIEASYKKINKNYVITDDLKMHGMKEGKFLYWDGYRAHINLIIQGENFFSNGHYYGILGEVVTRKFQPIYTNILEPSQPYYSVVDKGFSPTEKSYNLYFNFGSLKFSKVFFWNYFMGIGLGYTKFNCEGEEFNNSQYVLSDVLLSNRKASRISPAVRMGISIGFCAFKN